MPAAFDEVIATGMAKDPDERYATTVALARAAQDAITTPIPRPAPAVAPQPPTEPAPVPASPPTVVGVSASAPTQQRQPHEVPTLRAPDRPPPAPAPSTRPRWRRRSVVISAGVVLTVVAVIVGVTLAVAGNHRGPTSNAPGRPRRCCPSPASTVQMMWRWTPRATSTSPTRGNSRVVKLAAGSTTPTVLPFTGLTGLTGGHIGVAVDTNGGVYVADGGNTGW